MNNNDKLLGRGYSLDSQQLATEICYNTTVNSISGQQGLSRLTASLSFEQFVEELNIDFSAKGSVYAFTSGGEFDYLHFIQDQELSLSLNYYSVAYSQSSLQINGLGTGILNSEGAELYDNGENEYFNILCGNNIITSYNQGAILMLGLKISFASSYDKQKFTIASGGSFSDIFSASLDIQKTVTDLNINGNTALGAYQKGGEPGKLGGILSKDSQGNYYSISCTLTDMSSCVKAADGLLSYAKYNFTSQFSVDTNQNVTILGVGQYHYVPSYEFNLTVSSLLTPEVQTIREELSNALKEYQQYYQPFLHALLEHYPVLWNENSDLYHSLVLLNKQVTNNIETITNTAPQQGGIGCFDYPTQCSVIAKNIFDNITPVTSESLQFLSQIQYFINIGSSGADSCFENAHFANLYYNGAPFNGAAWGFVNLHIGSYFVQNIDFMYVNYTKETFDTPSFPFLSDMVVQTTNNMVQHFYNPRVNLETHETTMDWTLSNGQNGNQWNTYTCKSPFYFELYNNSTLALGEIESTQEV